MYINKKKVLVIAVAAACGLPFAAQAQGKSGSSVTIYGKLFPQITRAELQNATAPGTAVSTLARLATTRPADVENTGIEPNASRIGFRGKEKLGNGMTALFQLETQVGVDDGAGGTGGGFWNRDTYVGLQGGFGTIKLGQIDTVYKDLGETLSFLGIGAANFVSNSGVVSRPGLGRTASSFNLRPDNNLYYESPKFGAFQGRFSYSFGEVAGATSSGAIVSGGVSYRNGPIYVALMHEQHNDLYGGSRNVSPALSNFDNTARRGRPGTSAEDTATRLTAQYRFGTTRVEANLARLEYEESGGAAGRFASYQTTTWSLGAQHKMGATTLQASYAQADDGSCSLVGAACDARGLDARQFNIGAAYDLSKRTYLFAIASALNNGESARFSNGGIAGNPAHGQDSRQYAVGVSHRF